MKWPKDRRKAFLWAAEAFGTPYDIRTKKQTRLTLYGICWAISELTHSNIAPYTWVCDFGRGAFMENNSWWPDRDDEGWTQQCDKQRFLFCCLMAALSDKEFEELAK